MTNIAIITGRIVRDPDTRETKGGTNVTGITVVTDRPARDKDGKTYKDENGYTAKESEFHRVTCFNGLAKTVGQYCSKGQLVSVQGRIHYTQWEDKDGGTRYGTEILADKVDFLSRGNGSGDDHDNQDAPEIDRTLTSISPPEGVLSQPDRAPSSRMERRRTFSNRLQKRCYEERHD